MVGSAYIWTLTVLLQRRTTTTKKKTHWQIYGGNSQWNSLFIPTWPGITTSSCIPSLRVGYSTFFYAVVARVFMICSVEKMFSILVQNSGSCHNFNCPNQPALPLTGKLCSFLWGFRVRFSGVKDETYSQQSHSRRCSKEMPETNKHSRLLQISAPYTKLGFQRGCSKLSPELCPTTDELHNNNNKACLEASSHAFLHILK